MTKQFLRPGMAVLGLTLLAVVVSAFAGSGAPSPAQPAASAHPQEKDLAPAKLQYYWTRELDLTGTERIMQVYLRDENLYLTTNTNYFRAVDAAVGNPKWQVRVGNNSDENHIFEPTHVSDMLLPERIGTIDDIEAPESTADFDTFDAVLVNSMTNLMIIERKKGKVYRDVRFKNLIATNAGVSDGTSFYVGTGQREYCAIKLLPNILIWKENLGQIVATPMAYFDGRLFMGTLDGLLRCADVNNYGEKRWDRTFDGSLPEKCHVDAKGLFFACNDHRIYAMDPYTGKEIWPAVVVKGSVGGPLQVGEKTLFQYIEKDGLYAVNITNGEVRWKLPTGQAVLAIIDDIVYVLDTDKKLHLVNEVTGKEIAVVPFAGFDFYALNTTTPAIYTATRSGQIFCLRPTKAGRLTAEMLTK